MSKHLVIAGALAWACMGAHAASTDLAVEATITPEACGLSLSNDGKADYGDVDAATVKGYVLWNGTHYALPKTVLLFEINCSSATTTALLAVDNRAWSKESGLADPQLKYGLGIANGRSVGFFEVAAMSVRQASFLSGPMGPSSYTFLMNGRAVLRSGSSWAAAVSDQFGLSQQFATGFTKSAGRSNPEPAQRLFGQLEVTPRLATTVINGAAGPIPMAGSMTLSLMYP